MKIQDSAPESNFTSTIHNYQGETYLSNGIACIYKVHRHINKYMRIILI